MAVIYSSASSAVAAENADGGVDPHASALAGFKAVFWACFALAILAAFVGALALRNSDAYGGKAESNVVLKILQKEESASRM